jgi:hypothetical protein
MSYDSSTLIVERGSPPRVLLQIIEREEADLVIAGTLRWESSLSKYDRSIAGRVVRHSKKPTWLISRSLNAERKLSTAVLSSKFGEASYPFLAWYLPWARRLGLQTLHVVERGDSDAYQYSSRFSSVEDLDLDRSTILSANQAAVAWACGVKLRFVQLVKRTWCDSLWYAEALSADVLCVPLTEAQIRVWDRLLRHGIDPDLDRLPKSVLIIPQGSASEPSLLRPVQAA